MSSDYVHKLQLLLDKAAAINKSIIRCLLTFRAWKHILIGALPILCHVNFVTAVHLNLVLIVSKSGYTGRTYHPLHEFNRI